METGVQVLRTLPWRDPGDWLTLREGCRPALGGRAFLGARRHHPPSIVRARTRSGFWIPYRCRPWRELERLNQYRVESTTWCSTRACRLRRRLYYADLSGEGLIRIEAAARVKNALTRALRPLIGNTFQAAPGADRQQPGWCGSTSRTALMGLMD